MLHQREAGFNVGDEVTMKVRKRVMINGKEKTRVSFDAFTVAERHRLNSRWQYRLKDSRGLLHGTWLSEGDFNAA